MRYSLLKSGTASSNKLITYGVESNYDDFDYEIFYYFLNS